MAGADAATDPAKPAEKSGPVLDPQTEELFRFIDTLKKLKENEDLEKAGAAAVIQQSKGGGMAALALGATALIALGVVGYGVFTWLTSTQTVELTDPVQILKNAHDAYDGKRYDDTITWSDKILNKQQDYNKGDIQDAALLSVKSRMALDKIKDAGKAADTYSRLFDSDSGAPADKRGEFHHLEGELWLKLGRLGPDQRFKEAYESDKRNFVRLRDKLRYIQCLLSEGKDLGTQMTLLDELEKEANDFQNAPQKDKSELIDKIKDWRKHLEQLKS
ncbi:MAG TPA: hypothetical protein VL860_15295 [Planctomycetota bacterium]|nr:hypothetical protein [Planctomycetota bacterium]